MRWEVQIMKSKTSCFNRTIFKKNVTHYWPVWALYLLYLLAALPVMLWQETTSRWFLESRNEISTVLGVIQDVLQNQIMGAPTFIAAAGVALAVFSYLYTTKNANMIHALPVNRLELFVTNYLSGLSFLLIPELIAFLVTVLVGIGNEITSIQYLFQGFLCQAGLSFFFYSLAVFVAMFTGHMLAMPVYYVVVNFLYVGCMYIVSRVVELMGYGISSAWNPGKSCILSPLYYLGNNLWVRGIHAESTGDLKGLEIQGTYLVGIYVAAGVVLFAAAYQLYKRRQLETAGDWVSIGIVKPIFRWGVALCGGISLAVGITEFLQDSHNVNVYVCLLFGTVVAGFICFFVAEMLLEKSFRVLHKKRIFEWIGFAAAAVLFITLFKVDAFGVERRVPNADQIEAAFVYMDYPIQVKGEEIEELLAIHHEIIRDKKEYLENEQNEESHYYTTFRYYLKDGSVFERRYPMPLTEPYVKDETSATGKLLAWERRPENLKREILGFGYENNQYMSGDIDLYDETLVQKSYTFEGRELEEIVAALEKDIEEGNFEKYYLWSLYNGDSDNYYNNIYLNYYNENADNDNWDYYYYYRDYVNGTRNRIRGMERASVAGTSIAFGADCINTVAVLKELGIVDDTWMLMTQEEYDAYADTNVDTQLVD